MAKGRCIMEANFYGYLKTNSSVFHCFCSPANRCSPDEESGAVAFIRFI